MKNSWWQHPQWRFVADMNGDGSVSAADFPFWAEWLFLLPGHAFIARFGTTPVGQWLELSPASFGTPTAAVLAAALWLAALAAIFYVPRFLIDAWDPTYRQQERERREAAARAKRLRKKRPRLTPRERQALLQPDLRREPALNALEERR